LPKIYAFKSEVHYYIINIIEYKIRLLYLLPPTEIAVPFLAIGGGDVDPDEAATALVGVSLPSPLTEIEVLSIAIGGCDIAANEAATGPKICAFESEVGNYRINIIEYKICLLYLPLPTNEIESSPLVIGADEVDIDESAFSLLFVDDFCELYCRSLVFLSVPKVNK